MRRIVELEEGWNLPIFRQIVLFLFVRKRLSAKRKEKMMNQKNNQKKMEQNNNMLYAMYMMLGSSFKKASCPRRNLENKLASAYRRLKEADQVALEDTCIGFAENVLEKELPKSIFAEEVTVLLKSDDIYAPREVMVDFKRPLLTIPNLAIHYNREVNDGVKLTKQNDMLPLLGMLNDKLNKQSYFIDMLAKEIREKKENILDFDLYVYNAEEPEFIGMNKEMLSAPRLDNITSCLALVEGLTESVSGKTGKEAGLNVIALFDNEEIGSETKQGADSELLRVILKKIYRSLGKDEISLDMDIRKGFLLSVDVAHALHPAKGDKYDPVNNMRMGEGVTLKLSANQRYTYDGVAVASLQQLCDKYSIKYKKFVNNSDMPGGGTLGPIISSHLPMYTVDIGVPILAMHSARELMGASDQDELLKLMTAFFS